MARPRRRGDPSHPPPGGRQLTDTERRREDLIARAAEHKRWHHERHGITDPKRALGPEPEDLHVRAERRPVERTVEDVRAELSYLARGLERPDTGRPEPGYDRGPCHGLGHGMERGLDHGPSLGMGR